MGASELLIRHVMYEAIQYSSYKTGRGQFVSQAIIEKKRLCYKAFDQTQVFPLAEQALAFLSQNNFLQDQLLNTQNSHWFAVSPKYVLGGTKIMYPVSFIVFGRIANDGNIMPTFIVPLGLKLNREAYIKWLEEVVLLQVKRVSVGSPCVWQQDPAPC